MELAEIRERIDEVDEELLSLFLRRMALAEEAAAYKRERGLPILNREREREILARARERSGELERYGRYFFAALFALARARQAELLSRPSEPGDRIREALEEGSECVFLLELEAPARNEAVLSLLRELEANSPGVRFLGGCAEA